MSKAAGYRRRLFLSVCAYTPGGQMWISTEVIHILHSFIHKDF